MDDIKRFKFLQDPAWHYQVKRSLTSLPEKCISSFKELRRFHVFLILTCVYAMFIFYLSSLSSPPGPSDIGFLRGVLRDLMRLFEDMGLEFLIYPLYIPYRYPDKFSHVILYMFFGFLLHFTLRNAENRLMTRYASLFAVILGTIYGITDEIHQAFVPFRTPSYADLLADFIGLSLAQAFIFMYARVKALFEARLEQI